MAVSSTLNSAYLFLGGSIIVVVTVTVLFVNPLFRDIGAVQEATVAKQLELQEREQFLQTVDAKIAALQTQQVHETRLSVMLPEEDAIEDALRIINEAAASSGVVVNTVRNTSAAAQATVKAARARGDAAAFPGTVEPLSFLLDVDGAYRQVRSFIQDLERSPRLMDISSVNVGSNSDTPDSLGGQISVTFYRYSPRLLTGEQL